MANPVLGKNAVLEMFVDDDYYPLLCATDIRFTYSPEFIEKTTTESGTFQEFEVRLQSWTAYVTGLTKVLNDTVLSLFYALQTSVRRQKQLFRVTFTDDSSNSKQIEGYAFIGNAEINGPAQGFSQANIELKGTGAFSISDVEPPGVIDYDTLADFWQTSNGVNYISGASSGEWDGTSYTLDSDDKPLEVDMEGSQYDIVSGTPTPGTRTCMLDLDNGRIYFPADVIFDGSQRVFVEWKRPV